MRNYSPVMPLYRQPTGQNGMGSAGQHGMGMSGQMPLFPPSPAIGTTIPTGIPLGPTYAPVPVPASALPSVTASGPSSMTPVDTTPQSVQNSYYTAGFLKTQIGKRMRIEFLIGTNGPLIDRSGTLLTVGASYVVIRPDDTDDLLMCDLYSIKFVTILQ